LDNWYRAGADGFATFNFGPFRSDWLDELRDPKKVSAGRRSFTFLRYKGTVEDLYILRPSTLSFRKHELGVRKSIPFPPIAALAERSTPGVLRLEAQQLAWDDQLEIDVDGRVLSGAVARYDGDPKIQSLIRGQKAEPDCNSEALLPETSWPPLYTIEVGLPPSNSYSELGLRLIRRADIWKDIQIKRAELVLPASA
jgi:hypothetical protein